MLEGIERDPKERQGQNWPGKNLLPKLSMKMKVATFVFLIHQISMKGFLFFITAGVLLSGIMKYSGLVKIWLFR